MQAACARVCCVLGGEIVNTKDVDRGGQCVLVSELSGAANGRRGGEDRGQTQQPNVSSHVPHSYTIGHTHMLHIQHYRVYLAGKYALHMHCISNVRFLGSYA